MKKLTVSLCIVFLIGALAIGYNASKGKSNSDDVAITKVGAETIAVTKQDISGRLYKTLPEFLDSAPVIVEARVTNLSDVVAEVQPSSSREGAVDGEGRMTYGAIDFQVLSVLKGDPKLNNIKVVWESGQRDGRNKNQRIVYRREALNEFQLQNGTLKSAGSLSDKQFVLFLEPNTEFPVEKGNSFTIAHPLSGIATVQKENSKLKFGYDEKAPVSADGDGRNGLILSEDELKNEVAKSKK